MFNATIGGDDDGSGSENRKKATDRFIKQNNNFHAFLYSS